MMIELSDVSIPPEYFKPHILRDGVVMVLLREGLETREESAFETSRMTNTSRHP